MGDAIIGLSAAQYLKKLYPGVKITYALPPWICPLFENIESAVDEILPLDLKGASGWWKTFVQFRRSEIDCIHELFQAGRSGKFFGLYRGLTAVPYSFHNHHLKKGDRVLDQGVIKPVIQRDLDGVWSYYKGEGEPPNYLDFTPVMEVKNKRSEKIIVLGVVATRETKMWPLKFYAELTQLLASNYPDHKIWIPLSPSPADQKIKEDLKNLGLHPKVSFVEVPLSELPEKLSSASLYIGNDTGLKHLCIALGIKTYTFFGPEPPLEWHPYLLDSHPIYYQDGLECRTRSAHYCGLSVCESMICLNQFPPSNLITKIQELGLL